MEHIQTTVVPSRTTEPGQGLESQEDSQPFSDTQSFAEVLVGQSSACLREDGQNELGNT